MFHFLSVFFLNLALKNNSNKERVKTLPSEKINLLIVMIDEVQKKEIDSLEQKINTLFMVKQLMFVVVNPVKAKDSIVKEDLIDITLKDFNFFGRFNPQKLSQITSQNADLFINLIDNENVYNNYIASVINSSLKITFIPRIEKIYDIIISTNGETDYIRKIEYTSKYIKALNGKTNNDQ